MRSPGQPSVHKTDDVELIDRRYDHPDAARLLLAFRHEQVGRYGFADPVDANPAEYEGPHGAFLVAYHHGGAGGCGGFHWFDRARGVAEFKKLYVVPELRGHGLGRLLLTALERRAVARGARQVILESGVRNHAALHLFYSLGYQPTPRYVDSRDPKINRAFTKTLTSEFSLPTPDPVRASA